MLTKANFLKVLSAAAKTETGDPWEPHRICQPAVEAFFFEWPVDGLPLCSLLAKKDIRMFLECGRRHGALTRLEKDWGYSNSVVLIGVEPFCKQPCKVVYERKVTVCQRKSQALAIEKGYQRIPCTHRDIKDIAKGFAMSGVHKIVWGVRSHQIPAWYDPYFFVHSPRQDIRTHDWNALAIYIHIHKNISLSDAIQVLISASHSKIKEIMMYRKEIFNRIDDKKFTRVYGLTRKEGIALFREFPDNVGVKFVPGEKMQFALQSPWVNISPNEILALVEMLAQVKGISWEKGLQRLISMSDEERNIAMVALKLSNV